MFVYSSELLCSLNPAPDNSRIERTLRKVLFKFKIWRPRSCSSSKTGNFDRTPNYSPSTRREHSKIASSQLKIGSLNSRSAASKAPLLHNLLQESRLDVLAITETWIPSDAPQTIKADLAPPGYKVIHQWTLH